MQKKDRKATSVILPLRFKLQVGVTMVCSGWVNAVFIRNDLPELCTDLVAALSSLNVHELTHGCCWKQEERSQTALRVAGGPQDKQHISVLRSKQGGEFLNVPLNLYLLSCFKPLIAKVNLRAN